MARLIIYEESEHSESVFETFELSSTRILIGSDPDNNLVLQSPEVDSSHASLELRNNLWVLQDLGGPGGTGVNGRLIQGPYYLFHNDMIELGHIRLNFQEKEAEAAEHSPLEEAIPAVPPPMMKIDAKPVKGRVWFAFIAGGTLGVIFIIMFLLIVADFLKIIEISDLLPLMMLLGWLL
ncbi:MAG: FHA domain-containing protein [Anaerolineae bacterium]|nr:FHA domain-containing protein [Anaerolineae bacterium]